MVEYRVRPVVRYIVTRYTEYPEFNARGSSEVVGEFPSEDAADKVVQAFRAEEKERARWESHIAMERAAQAAHGEPAVAILGNFDCLAQSQERGGQTQG